MRFFKIWLKVLLSLATIAMLFYGGLWLVSWVLSFNSNFVTNGFVVLLLSLGLTAAITTPFEYAGEP